MLVIDNAKAAKIERMADKISYVFEKIVSFRQGYSQDMLMELVELGEQADAREIAELFKEIANARTDKYMMSVFPQLRIRDRMIHMMLVNEYNCQPLDQDAQPHENWIKERKAEYRTAAEKSVAEDR